MLTTVSALCDRVRRDTGLAQTGPLYTLASATLAGATALPLNEDPEHFNQGITVAVDFELFHVQSVDVGSSTLTVIPGYHSSTQAAHDQNAIVEVDPRIPKASMLDWIEHEIRTWRTRLFRVVTVDIPVTTSTRAYDLTGATDVDFLLGARLMPTGTPSTNFSWTGDSWPNVEVKVLRGMDAASFASGFALQLLAPPRTATTLRVAYATDFDYSGFDGVTPQDTDLVDDVGLETGWLSILEAALTAKMLDHSLSARTDWRASGMSQDSEGVSPLDVLRAAEHARSRRDELMSHHYLALRSQWPYMSR